MVYKPCVYILQSTKDDAKYIGSTCNLERRLKEHNYGSVKSTRLRRPLKLIGYRFFDDISVAALWERKYKRSHGQLQRDFRNAKILQV